MSVGVFESCINKAFSHVYGKIRKKIVSPSFTCRLDAELKWVRVSMWWRLRIPRLSVARKCYSNSCFWSQRVDAFPICADDVVFGLWTVAHMNTRAATQRAQSRTRSSQWCNCRCAISSWHVIPGTTPASVTHADYTRQSTGDWQVGRPIGCWHDPANGSGANVPEGGGWGGNETWSVCQEGSRWTGIPGNSWRDTCTMKLFTD